MVAPVLTWKEARWRLKELLVEYIDGPPPKVLKSAAFPVPTGESAAQSNGSSRSLSACMEWWLKHDMDLASALLLSLALLILACFSWITADDLPEGDINAGSILNAHAQRRVYHAQLAAAILLVISSLTGIWMVQRRHFACRRDVDSVKRREIQRFLKSMETNESANDPQQQQQPQSSSRLNSWLNDSSYHRTPIPNPPGPQPNNPHSTGGTPLKLQGTSLTDIYPVYRLSNDQHHGSWTRIPTLLLVQGDYVALQVGDIAPARCKAIHTIGESATSVMSTEIRGGERITMELIGENKATSGQKANLPKGRSTLSPDSEQLLTLCNDLRIYLLLESPLYEFLRQSQGKGAIYFHV